MQEVKLQIPDSSLDYSESQETLSYCETINRVTTIIVPETIHMEPTPEQMENTSDNTSNSDVCQESITQCSASPIHTESKSLEDKKVDEFLESECKRHISNEIRERNTEKKIQDHTSAESEQVSIDQKIPYNQKVEQDLMHELSVCAEKTIAMQDIDAQIPELPLEIILAGSDKITTQIIVDLFNTAMKTRQKENLCWYCYAKAYEYRVMNIKSTKNINEQSARTLVYNEIRVLLPGITGVNL
ncbi:7658_t:CDS:1, partial [Entrophospora sp. SA101]